MKRVVPLKPKKMRGHYLNVTQPPFTSRSNSFAVFKIKIIEPAFLHPLDLHDP
jgi:hypothetical protein